MNVAMNTRWFITGVTGQLGGTVLPHLLQTVSARDVLALQRSTAVLPCAALPGDLAQPTAWLNELCAFRPTHILHMGAMTAVSDAYATPELAEQINHHATRRLAELAADLRARFVYVSTDMVFAGDAAPYDEAHEPAPLSVYARTKLRGERAIAPAPTALIVRLPLLYGFPANRRRTTFVQQIETLRSHTAGESVVALRLFTDEFRTPLAVADAARAVIGLARSDAAGLLHVGGPERLSRLDLVRRAADILKLPTQAIEPISRLSIPATEPRPADLSLNSARFLADFPTLRPRPLSPETLSQEAARA